MRMKTSLLFSFLFYVFTNLPAQVPEFLWEKTMFGNNSHGKNVFETQDGGYVIFGSYLQESESMDYWLFKLDENLELVWEQVYGGSLSEEAINALQTEDGGFLLSGNTYSSDADVSENHGGSDFWLVKTDAEGNLEWEKSFGGSGDEHNGRIVEVPGNGYLLTGSTNSNDGDVGGNMGSSDYWVVKITTEGEIEWENNFGGSGFEVPVSAIPTADEGFIVAGYTESTDGQINNPHGDFDYWVIKIDQSGNLNWEKSLGGSYVDKPMGIMKDHEDGYLVFGNSNSSNGDISFPLGANDGWVIKLDEDGNIIWDKSFGGEGTDGIIDFKLSPNGGYIYSGVYQPENSVARCIIEETDADGNEIWEKLFGMVGWWGIDYYQNEIKYDEDGNLLSLGDFTSDYFSYAWLAKLSLENMGISEIEKTDLKLYPNPAKNYFYLNSKIPIDKIEIYNAAGQIVLTTKLNAETNPKVNIESVVPGIYQVKIQTQNFIHSLKILVR